MSEGETAEVPQQPDNIIHAEERFLERRRQVEQEAKNRAGVDGDQKGKDKEGIADIKRELLGQQIDRRLAAPRASGDSASAKGKEALQNLGEMGFTEKKGSDSLTQRLMALLDGFRKQ